jgi:hypothetical protein
VFRITNVCRDPFGNLQLSVEKGGCTCSWYPCRKDTGRSVWGASCRWVTFYPSWAASLYYALWILGSHMVLTDVVLYSMKMT